VRINNEIAARLAAFFVVFDSCSAGAAEQSAVVIIDNLVVG
jgi:hypothetical protein